MQQNISNRMLREILGTELKESGIIDRKMEEAYEIIRKSGNKTGKERRKSEKTAKRKGRRVRRKILPGLVSAAAILAITFIFGVRYPALAKEIPILGSIFAKVSDVFPFGKLPEEDTKVLHTEEADTAETIGDSFYRKTEGDITITLTEEYVSNQAVFIGVRVESGEGFPEMTEFADGTQMLQAETVEKYSFRQGQIAALRSIEGKFEDAHTFLGVMRIDYSDIDTDESKYEEAVRNAEENGEEIPVLTDADLEQYLDKYEIPSSFKMELEITNIIGYLAEPTRPEGMKIKSAEELEKMTDEEWSAYMKTLPPELDEFPNKYENWYQEGKWTYELLLRQKDEASRVIEVNETNEDGIGIASLELSSVEMTLNTIEPGDASTIAVALDADGMKIDSGSSNFYELAITGHDISKVYIYICGYDEYMDELKGYAINDQENFRNILEERSLFKTVVNTGE